MKIPAMEINEDVIDAMNNTEPKEIIDFMLNERVAKLSKESIIVIWRTCTSLTTWRCVNTREAVSTVSSFKSCNYSFLDIY